MLALLLPGALASADEGGNIVVLSDEVTSQFPDGISFELSLQSPVPIDDVRVFYTSRGERTTAYGHLDIEATGSGAAGSFFLDTSVGGQSGVAFIPPGTTFSYSYEVTDQAGNTLTTEEKEFVYIDSRFEWDSISEGPVTVYYYGPTETRAEIILAASISATGKMSGILGLDEVEPINIMAYSNYRHMASALPPRSQSVREGLVTQGQAFTNLRVLLVLASDEGIEGITAHEIIHVLVDDAAGRAERLVPAWLNEGLAEFGNTSPSESYENALLYGIYTRRLKPLAHLSSFRGDPNDIVIAYGHSSSVVSYLIGAYGEDKISLLMDALDQRLSVDDAMMAVYGFDQHGLDTQWRSRMGLRPFAEDAAPAAPTVPSTPPPPTPALAEATPVPEPTGTPAPKEEEASRSPGCGRGGGPNANAPVEPFLLLALAGPLGLLPLRRIRRPK